MRGIRFSGDPILIVFRHELRASQGKLVSGGADGQAVYAGSFLRKRLIVLDFELFRKPAERDRILAHEIFHFVWWKLPNRVRLDYEELIREEFGARVRGEMGWSSEWRKALLGANDWNARTPRLRGYLCESFCDTAAAALLRLTSHDEITLGKRARGVRCEWMEEQLAGRSLKI